MRPPLRVSLLQRLEELHEASGGWNDRVFPRSKNFGTSMALMALMAPRLPTPAGWTPPEGAFEPVTQATPSDAAAEQTDSPRAFLGVTSMDEEGGVVVQQVSEGSAAEKAGLQRGHLLMEIDGKALAAVQDLLDALSKKKPGDIIALKVKRDLETLNISATLGARSQ